MYTYTFITFSNCNALKNSFYSKTWLECAFHAIIFVFKRLMEVILNWSISFFSLFFAFSFFSAVIHWIQAWIARWNYFVDWWTRWFVRWLFSRTHWPGPHWILVSIKAWSAPIDPFPLKLEIQPVKFKTCYAIYIYNWLIENYCNIEWISSNEFWSVILKQ